MKALYRASGCLVVLGNLFTGIVFAVIGLITAITTYHFFLIEFKPLYALFFLFLTVVSLAVCYFSFRHPKEE
ncbi:putative Co/Zn/Cd cation transporter (cation efflux family) [Bacillus tianshenii]|uniref:Co/Zn/Cd cation transporter (Cation efflux family) n=1 Tax=Sutcliffiella tianshenii TaxID=1463404 RepID=A0ABS2P418_9BACI|nr:hypothetical protein [Bacillus tianshenii]MBM7621606.1 putative Co/Zn/Cd cation transporter (cation efflux family) [Bacillus tianshenii]